MPSLVGSEMCIRDRSSFNSQRIRIRKCSSSSDTFFNVKLYQSNKRVTEIDLDDKVLSIQAGNGQTVAWFKTKDLFELRFQTIHQIKKTTKYFKAAKKNPFSLAIFAPSGIIPNNLQEISLQAIIDEVKQFCFEPITIELENTQHQILFCCKFKDAAKDILL